MNRAGLSTSFGSLFLLIGAWLLYTIMKRRKKIKLKENSVDRSKLFNSKELHNATDHFNVNRILGQGGQVKKSKIIDKGKVEEFINEVVILSQINHRNVENNLYDILDAQVKMGKEEEITAVADLAIRLAMDLDGIPAPEKVNNVQLNVENFKYESFEATESCDSSTSKSSTYQ
ncbi:hypothetical protein ACOSP7_004066 [Xanthoceras sorbifolium]